MKKVLSLILIGLILVPFLTACGLGKNFSMELNENTEIYYESTPQENIKDNNKGTKYSDNEVLVVAKENVSKSKIEKLAGEYNAEIVGYIEITGDYQWRLRDTYSYDELQELIASIKEEEDIENATLQSFFEIADEAFFVPNDERWEKDWDPLNPGGENWGLEAIYAPYAWQYINEMTPIRLGLIDNMFNTAHEDLVFAETYYNPEQSDISNDHGTHVAGTMAAGFNNGKGITGVYPFGLNKDNSSNLFGVSWNGTEKNLSLFFWKTAFAKLIVNNVKVINLSLGYADEVRIFLAAKGYTEVQDEIKATAEVMGDFLEKFLEKGYDFVIVQSAGNSKDSHFKKTADSDEYPYGWRKVFSKGETNVYGLADWGFWVNAIENEAVKDRILVVGAAKLKTAFFSGKKSYELAEFSNTGDRVDVIAPGYCITSCSYKNKYSTKDGTSMAAPHVAGAAATLWSYNTGLSGKRVKEILIETASTNVGGTNVGMINLLRALADSSDERKEGNPFATQDGFVAGCVYGGKEIQSGARVEFFDSTNDKLVDTKITDSSGSFESILSRGSYYLLVTQEGFNLSTVEDIAVDNGDVIILDNILLNESVSDFSIPQEIVITLGEIGVIEPETVPINATGYSMKWYSSDGSVATVSPNGEAGIITTLTKGTTSITAELTSGGKTITKTTNVRVASKARDTVLVLDISGSMGGEPLDEMKKSAIQFCNDLLKDEYNNRVGVVFYDSEITAIDLTDDLDMLIRKIQAVEPGGRTDMEAGLSAADRMLTDYGRADSIKNVVIMADGLPNIGRTSYSDSMPGGSYSGYNTSAFYANAVIDTAKEMMNQYNLYSLGFFHSLYDEERDFATALMNVLTNQADGYHQVERAEDLQFAFGDISEDINVGSKIVINIACPVDVQVSYGGEVLSSAESAFCDATSFGTLQMLGKDRDIKVVSLDSNKEYEVELIGTGDGKMDYSVNYFDEREQLVDYRSFETVPISTTTIIKSSTNNATEDIALNIDEDGDGEIDVIWTASAKSEGEITYEKNPTEPETPEEEKPPIENKVVIPVCVIVLLSVLAGAIRICRIAALGSIKKRKTYPDESDEMEIDEEDPLDKEVCPRCGKAHPSNVPCNSESEQRKHQITEGVECSTGLIQITNGSMNGYSIPIKDGETLYLGKDARVANIVFTSDYKNVSRLHCAVTFDAKASRYYVTDSSSNGTYLLGNKRLSKGRRTPVNANTVLLLANEDCTILLG